MGSTTPNKSYFPLGIFLSPFLSVFLLGFSLYSWRHRKGYKGTEDFTHRYSFFKKVFLSIFQLQRQIDTLEGEEHLSRKSSLIVLYSKSFSWEILSLGFLLSNFYRDTYQLTRFFRYCVLSTSRPWWYFLTSSVEILERVPSPQFLKEFEHSLVCFSDDLDQLKKLSLNSFKNVVFVKLESSFSWKKGTNRVFQVVGSISSKERLKAFSETELKIDQIMSRLN
ncbi:hypothetical protein MHLP_03590 [Candidatus Mycoplasma haematolamae str. Purdue]|uniref:Uncharacterized protein n=1 Tax=Mycoplasma haematolamae (strain Purdue) TaxID=1212765 RepID=I7BK91_MYCHA|nr:hypothetical protein [Candidatus Mycoplasma haematolamae]AFO52298.1 hypothetical protein MHLP_03590 [Candidatus Mycoplasma haematolamae str. Purdue]